VVVVLLAAAIVVVVVINRWLTNKLVISEISSISIII
jgi:hypothetical protein